MLCVWGLYQFTGSSSIFSSSASSSLSSLVNLKSCISNLHEEVTGVLHSVKSGVKKVLIQNSGIALRRSIFLRVPLDMISYQLSWANVQRRFATNIWGMDAGKNINKNTKGPPLGFKIQSSTGGISKGLSWFFMRKG